jgi:hypothetical protein
MRLVVGKIGVERCPDPKAVGAKRFNTKVFAVAAPLKASAIFSITVKCHGSHL